MIVLASGEVVLPVRAERLGPSITPATLVMLGAQAVVANPPHLAYSFADGGLSITAYFEGSRLTSLTMAEADGGAGGWSSWSEEREQKRHRRHLQLVQRWLGPPPWSFRWGTVDAEFDPRSGGSYILVQYTHQD